jgi:hypothetical protein
MLLRVLTIVPFTASLAFGQGALQPKKSQKSLRLEIKFVEPPAWQGPCLNVGITLINRSKSRIFLNPNAFQGIRIYSTVTRAKNLIELTGKEDWILVYGETDVFYPSSIAIQPGSERRETYCVPEAFIVKDMISSVERSVHLRGKLRITSEYQQNQANGLRHEGHSYVQKYRRIRLQTTIEVAIPCPTSIPEADCSTPALIFPGERADWWVLPEAPVL